MMASSTNSITEVTRRSLFDAICLANVNWSGRLDDLEFLNRLYDLESLPSNDHRFSTAHDDIYQHRVRNTDGHLHWVLDDRRFNLLRCPDQELLRFLCETIHPVVCPEADTAEEYRALYNRELATDRYEIVPSDVISGRNVYVARRLGVAAATGLAQARESLPVADAGYLDAQLNRTEGALRSGDVALAIGTAKELVETVCKTILRERGKELPTRGDLPELVKLAARELDLTPESVDEKAKGADVIRNTLRSLSALTQGISDLRGLYGTGHGKHGFARGLSIRHAKLAVGAASSLAVFLFETHIERKSG